MDPKQFNHLVTELTELRRRTNNPGNQYEPNLNLALPKIKPQTQVCDDCGLKVKGRVVTIKRVEDLGDPHWRKRCNICKFVSISRLEIK
jgi:hypothetical protein